MNRAVAQPEAMTTRAVPQARIRSFLRLPEPDRGRSTAIAVGAPVPMPTSAGNDARFRPAWSGFRHSAPS
jgi:hypothetical protein